MAEQRSVLPLALALLAAMPATPVPATPVPATHVPAAPAGALTTATTTAPAAPVKTRVLVLETRADAAYLDKVKAFGDLLATILEQRTTAEIVPSSSVKDRLAVAADKLSAGCDEASCMTEIAGALDARWVVASRASQVGGRWLMRVELFDSQSLKVVAQVSAMSDSVEGLAAQAEHVADDLLAKAPMLATSASSPSGSSSSSSASSSSSSSAPFSSVGTEKKAPNVLPWVLAGTGGVLAVLSLGGWTASYLWAAGDESKLNQAIAKYQDDPSSADARKALALAGRNADTSSTWNNCVFAPFGCMSLPFLGVAAAGVFWGASANDESAP